jgi:hypothetical protein
VCVGIVHFVLCDWDIKACGFGLQLALLCCCTSTGHRDVGSGRVAWQASAGACSGTQHLVTSYSFDRCWKHVFGPDTVNIEVSRSGFLKCGGPPPGRAPAACCRAVRPPARTINSSWFRIKVCNQNSCNRTASTTNRTGSGCNYRHASFGATSAVSLPQDASRLLRLHIQPSRVKLFNCYSSQILHQTGLMCVCRARVDLHW